MTERLLTVAEIAAAYGLSLKTIYLCAAGGKLGEPIGRKRSLRFRQGAVEQHFKRSYSPQPSKKNEAAAIFDLPLKNADLFFVMRGAAETRDKEWLAHLRAHNIDLPAPSLEKNSAFRSKLIGRFFSFQQMLTLIERAVELRDRSWHIWRSHPCRLDAGPPPLEIGALDFTATSELDPTLNPIKWR